MTAFLDLFSGIGGFALGAYWAGLRFDAHYFSEVDDYAISVYQQRFPDAIPLGDITKIDGRALPEADWIIAGGFPCQDISVAGKGAGLEGSRSGLWYEYARLIGELRPRYAVMENVGALTFRGLDAVLGSLASLGYDAEWQDIRASDVGAPHRRERIWIVAYPQRDGVRNEPGRRHGAGRASSTELINHGAEGVMANPESERRGARGTRRSDSDSPWEAEQPHGSFPDADREPMGWATEPRSQCGNWLPESGFCRVAHGIPARVDRLKCLGNSIVPQIAELIFREIKE